MSNRHVVEIAKPLKNSDPTLEKLFPPTEVNDDKLGRSTLNRGVHSVHFITNDCFLHERGRRFSMI